MRKDFLHIFFLLLLLLPLSSKVLATEYITFFVYHQRNYTQGYWIHSQNLGESDSYLEVTSHEDLLGSEKIDLAYRIIEILQKDKPEAYSFLYELNLTPESTILISFEMLPDNWPLIRNELTASFLSNGFSLIFDLPNESIQAKLSDITIPFFDLKDNNKIIAADFPPKEPHQIIIKDTCYNRVIDEPISNSDSETSKANEDGLEKYGISFWWILVAFLISVVLNLFLLLNLFFKKS